MAHINVSTFDTRPPIALHINQDHKHLIDNTVHILSKCTQEPREENKVLLVCVGNRNAFNVPSHLFSRLTLRCCINHHDNWLLLACYAQWRDSCNHAYSNFTLCEYFYPAPTLTSILIRRLSTMPQT